MLRSEYSLLLPGKVLLQQQLLLRAAHDELQATSGIREACHVGCYALQHTDSLTSRTPGASLLLRRVRKAKFIRC